MAECNRSFPFRLLSLVAILTLFLNGCGAAPTSVATRIPTMRPNTPTPNLTSNLIPSPTHHATYTPAPTSTPSGYINLYYAGFSLTVPAAWHTVQPAGNILIVVSNAVPLAIGIISIAEEKPTSFAEMLYQVRSQLGPEVTLKHLADGEQELPGGVTAQTADYRIGGVAGKTELRVAYAHVGGFTYMIFIQTDNKGLEKRKLLIDSIVTSLHLFTPLASGLPHDQTLVTLGGEPAPEELDPAKMRGIAANPYVRLMFAGLVRLTPDLKVEPSLADQWSVSPDGLVYTFTLPQGLKFADGKPLTAKDVQASWERATDPELASPTARTYLGDIAGVNEKLDGKADSIRGVKVVDELTLEVTLDGPKPYFLYKLDYPSAYVVDVADTQKGSDWAFKANASGPYKLNQHEKDQELVFERNKNYPRLAAIPNVVFLNYGGGSALGVYQQDSLDFLPLSNADLNQVSKTNNPNHKDLKSAVSMCTEMLRFKPGNPPTDDANVRKALSLAIDKKTLLRKMDDSASLTAGGILPPAMPGYLDSRPAAAFDPQAAKAALAASKYAASIPPITLVVPGNADTASLNPFYLGLVEMWQKNLGIKVQMEYVDAANPVRGERESRGNILEAPWCADYPDPENFLDILFHSGTDFNVSQLQDPALDQLLEQVRTEPDSQKRLELYQQAETLILDQAYVLPVFYPVTAQVIQPRVKGFVVSPLPITNIPWLSLESEAE